jgi:hypothetical protein
MDFRQQIGCGKEKAMRRYAYFTKCSKKTMEHHSGDTGILQTWELVISLQ